MKIVVFGAERRVGALFDGGILDLNRANRNLPSDLLNFIAAGPKAIETAKKAMKSLKASAVIEGGVQLHAPWAGKRIAMAGANYADHYAGMPGGEGASRESAYEQVRQSQKVSKRGFWKVLDEVPGPDSPVPFPRKTNYLDYEGEAAIVIGKRGKDISASAINDYIWGVTLANDFSKRDDGGVPRVLSYNTEKNFDGACTMGPCIVVDELDCQNIDIQTKVNDEVRQQFNSRDMVFSFGELLEYLSIDFTFVPGDVISGGTGRGTAADTTKRNEDGSRPKDLFLKANDVVEVSSPHIGLLRNQLV